MDIVHVGYPIRKSTDLWIFAPPRGLSQLVTSFIGSWCQGIPLALFLAWPIKNKINLVLVVNYAGFTDCFLWNCNRYPSIRCSTIKITSCSVSFQTQTSLLPYLSLSYYIVQFSRCNFPALKPDWNIQSLECFNPYSSGGDYRDRTGDLLLARQALSQLS